MSQSTETRDRGGASGSWSEDLAPFTRRLRVAAAFPGLGTTWNHVGSAALLEILKEMAHRLDVVTPATIAELRAERDAAQRDLAETTRALRAAEARIEALQRGTRADGARRPRSWRRLFLR